MPKRDGGGRMVEGQTFEEGEDELVRTKEYIDFEIGKDEDIKAFKWSTSLPQRLIESEMKLAAVVWLALVDVQRNGGQLTVE